MPGRGRPLRSDVQRPHCPRPRHRDRRVILFGVTRDASGTPTRQRFLCGPGTLHAHTFSAPAQVDDEGTPDATAIGTTPRPRGTQRRTEPRTERPPESRRRRTTSSRARPSALRRAPEPDERPIAGTDGATTESLAESVPALRRQSVPSCPVHEDGVVVRRGTYPTGGGRRQRYQCAPPPAAPQPPPAPASWHRRKPDLVAPPRPAHTFSSLPTPARQDQVEALQALGQLTDVDAEALRRLAHGHSYAEVGAWIRTRSVATATPDFTTDVSGKNSWQVAAALLERTGPRLRPARGAGRPGASDAARVVTVAAVPVHGVDATRPWFTLLAAAHVLPASVDATEAREALQLGVVRAYPAASLDAYALLLADLVDDLGDVPDVVISTDDPALAAAVTALAQRCSRTITLVTPGQSPRPSSRTSPRPSTWVAPRRDLMDSLNPDDADFKPPRIDDFSNVHERITWDAGWETYLAGLTTTSRPRRAAVRGRVEHRRLPASAGKPHSEPAFETLTRLLEHDAAPRLTGRAATLGNLARTNALLDLIALDLAGGLHRALTGHDQSQPLGPYDTASEHDRRLGDRQLVGRPAQDTSRYRSLRDPSAAAALARSRGLLPRPPRLPRRPLVTKHTAWLYGQWVRAYLNASTLDRITAGRLVYSLAVVAAATDDEDLRHSTFNQLAVQLKRWGPCTGSDVCDVCAGTPGSADCRFVAAPQRLIGAALSAPDGEITADRAKHFQLWYPPGVQRRRGRPFVGWFGRLVREGHLDAAGYGAYLASLAVDAASDDPPTDQARYLQRAWDAGSRNPYLAEAYARHLLAVQGADLERAAGLQMAADVCDAALRASSEGLVEARGRLRDLQTQINGTRQSLGPPER